MHPELERLVTLQHAESELRRGEASLSDIPRRRQELQAELQAERARLDAAREGLAAAQKARKSLEGELQSMEVKRSKYKGQLMEVKTNKEYTAMLHEIEVVERDIRGVEDRILAEMEKAETLGAEVKHEEQHFKGAEESNRGRVAELEREAASLQARVEALRAEREQAASSLAPDSLALFQRVARQRGTAVAIVLDGVCTQCHVKLRPQFYLDIKRNEEVAQCPSCARILYYEPPPPEVVPQP